MDITHQFLQSDRKKDDLACLPLFELLNLRQLQQAQRVLHRKNVPAGQVLMAEAQAGEIVYVITKGAVRICVRRGEHDVIIGIRGRGDMLGEMSILDGGHRSATVITQTECVLYWVSSADFWEVLWPLPSFSMNVTKLMARRIRNLTGQIEAMATLSVQGRLARLLLSLAADYGVPVDLAMAPHALKIPFRLTQVDLANMIGATRVQVNQVFSQWKRHNWIAVMQSHIHVLDEATLRTLVD